MHEKDTEELWAEIRKDNDMKRFLSENQKEFRQPISMYLNQVMENIAPPNGYHKGILPEPELSS